ncbi:MAG: TIGR03862 family flavoprotein [Hyphomicrobiaceae bacterium]|nr:TIGR03862 family flavoprotein [Hyphomicrobiaceae bacterium]
MARIGEGGQDGEPAKPAAHPAVSVPSPASPPTIARATSSIAIVGAGPAGLMAAERLATRGYSVDVYDQMASPARKLLLAGRGGLNLTHSEPIDAFLRRYTPLHPLLEKALRAFTPDDLRAHAEGLGQETFIGSSGRVFPRAMKASPLLRAWLMRLDRLGVRLHTRRRFVGFALGSGAPLIDTPSGERIEIQASAVLLACGGASWPRLGSDGAWAEALRVAGIEVAELLPANCGVRIAWSDAMRTRHAGAPLKRITLSIDGARFAGEAIVTQSGLEGGPVYAAIPCIRRALARSTHGASIAIDLRPDLDAGELEKRLARPRGKQSAATWLRKATGLSPAAIALLREEGGGALPGDPASLARLIKAVPLIVTATAGLDRAISTAGGLPFDALDANLMVRSRPGLFAAGEMLDWEAPTGGYLLQATYATGVMAAEGIANWLGALSDRALAEFLENPENAPAAQAT